MKSIFASKTAALGFLTTLAGAIGAFFPSVNEWVSANSSAVLIGIGVASVALRLITKDKISIFPE